MLGRRRSAVKPRAASSSAPTRLDRPVAGCLASSAGVPRRGWSCHGLRSRSYLTEQTVMRCGADNDLGRLITRLTLMMAYPTVLPTGSDEQFTHGGYTWTAWHRWI